MANIGRAYKSESIEIRVVQYLERSVFRFGKWHFDQLIGHHILVPSEQATKPIDITVKRKRVCFDAGVLCLGSGTASDDFSGFKRIRPSGRPFAKQESLDPDWFAIGDAICFSADRRFLRDSIQHNAHIARADAKKERKCRTKPLALKVIPCRY